MIDFLLDLLKILLPIGLKELIDYFKTKKNRPPTSRKGKGSSSKK